LAIDDPQIMPTQDNNTLEERMLAFIRRKSEEAHPLVIVENKRQLQELNSDWINTAFPATTLEIALEVDLPTSTTSDILERLRRRKKIKRRTFSSFRGKEINLYIPYDVCWPDYLFRTCGQCENWNRFTHSCTFFQELAANGYQVDEQRLKNKIISDLMACKWYILRIARALKTFNSLQEFAEEIVDLDLWDQHEERDDFYLFNPKTHLPAYRCYECRKPMTTFGWGYFPLVGSAISACDHCGSLYKLIYDDKTDQYTVICSREKFHEYIQRYDLYTRGDKPSPNYSSARYGLSLAEINVEHDLIDDLEVLVNKNLYAYYNTLTFLVAHSQEEFDQLRERLQKDYPLIEVLLAPEPYKSVQPTKQQIGAVKLLQFEGSLTIPYSLDLFWSRLQVVEDLEEYVTSREVMTRQEKILQTIMKVQQMEKSGQQLTSDQWNTLDGEAANLEWELVKKIVESYGFQLPNRRYARHLEEDKLRPHGLHMSYSDANTIFNGTFGKISNVYHQKCNEQLFPWEGLPGICHKKTSKGVYAFTLDNVEGLRQAAIPKTIRTIAEEKIVPDMVSMVRLRKHIPIYFLEYGSEANKILAKDCRELLKQKNILTVNGQEREGTLEQNIEQLIAGLKELLDECAWMDELVISKQGTKIAPWRLAAEDRLHELSSSEQAGLKSAIRGVLNEAKHYFRPLRYQTTCSERLFDEDQ